MIALPGYRILAKIHESSNSLIYRGIRIEDNRSFIFKVLRAEYPSLEQIARYKHEFEITRSISCPGVIQAYELFKYRGRLLMILEDFGGRSLDRVMSARKFTLKEFLGFAIQITETVGCLHASKVIHKDLNPSNILVRFHSKKTEVKAIDFGISTLLDIENLSLKRSHVLEGTIAYSSPEQTGRMNRSLDYRTDFYSLGVTFYELLTQQLPFPQKDPLELIHCHIAKQPNTPHQLDPSIPPVLSDIVMKLLAKTAEDRYQSAWGLKTDLEKCLAQLNVQGSVEEFALGLQDTSDKFQIPQKL